MIYRVVVFELMHFIVITGTNIYTVYSSKVVIISIHENIYYTSVQNRVLVLFG